MPTPRTFAQVFTDVQKLLAAVDANVDMLPDLANAKAPLEATFTRLKDLSVRRDTLNADKQALSKELAEVQDLARDQTVELRGFVRSKIGMRSEKLVEFKVKPRRKGVRRSRGKSPEPTPEPTAAPTSTPSAPAASGGAPAATPASGPATTG